MKPVGTYVMVPDSLVTSKLSVAEKIVWIALAHFANEAGECWPSISTIAKFAGVSDRTVQRAMTTLVKKSWVTTSHPTTVKSTVYRIKMPYGCQNVTGVTLSPIGVSECHPPGVTLSPELISIELDSKETTKSESQPKRHKFKIPHVVFDPMTLQLSGIDDEARRAFVAACPKANLDDCLERLKAWIIKKGVAYENYWRTLCTIGSGDQMRGGTHGTDRKRGYRPSIEDAVFTGEDFIHSS